MAILPVGISGEAAGYQIERSLRFNSADSAYLNRTPSGAGTSATIWTFSWWQKGVALSAATQVIFGAESGGTRDLIRWDGSGGLEFTKGATTIRKPSAVYRDPSAWYHFVINVSGTSVGVYVNGEEVTAFATSNNPSGSWYIGQNNLHRIGLDPTGGDALNGYLAEVHFIDGQALTPSSFGETDTDTGVWKPKAYSGSYGTNGFYLDFADNSSTTALGYDAAGSNDWTPNNFSVTAGAGNDSLVDSPTRYGTDTGVGGEVRGNYATLNPLAKTSNVTLTNGNLDAAFGTVSGGGGVIGTIAPSSGKWYWEVTVTAASSASIHIGVIKDVLTTFSGTQYYEPGLTADGYAYQNDGTKYNNNTNTSYGASYTTNDVIGVAMDLDAGTLTFYKNNTSQGQAFSGLSGGYFPAVGDGSSAGTHSVTMNFGQRPFSYTAPSGFKALCTTNLPEPTIAEGRDYFNAVLYTGNGSTQSITGVGFQPDLVWAKNRTTAGSNHRLFDSVRGASKILYSSLTNAEATDADGLTAFNSDGFSIGATQINDSGANFVAWNWKESATSGFDIVTYTGTGSAQNIAHNLGVTPGMMIVKNRTTSNDWVVWHQSYASTTEGYTYLNSTGGVATTSIFWNSTAPTSSVFTVGTSGAVNESAAAMVAYLFAAVPGFSAFGSYTGNGSTDGPFVYCGFRPRYVLWKRTNTTGDWSILDTARDTYNYADKELFPNLSDAETVIGGGLSRLDILSNGFKVRGADSYQNASGSTYIYAAFAENPFSISLAR